MTGPDGPFIVRAGARGARRLRERLGVGPFRWVFLGGDAGTRASLEKALGGAGTFHPLNGPLQVWAERIQTEYVDYIGKAGEREDSPGWWASGLAEKNPDVSSVFLDLCRVLAAVEAAGAPGPWAFFVESDALGRALAGALGGRAEVLKTEPLGRLLRRACAAAARAFAHRVHFVLFHGALWVLARAFNLAAAPGFRRALADGRPLTVLYTWIDGRSFGPDGSFKDAYLGGLGRGLAEAGANVLTAVRVMAAAPMAGVMRRMSRAEEGFLEPHMHLGLGAILKRARESCTDFPWRLPWTLPPFRGIDVGDLALSAARAEWVYPRTAETLLMGDVARAWAAAKLPVGRFIYPFENRAWEKTFLSAYREVYPDAVAVGYQHGRLPRVLPNYRFGPGEPLPFPDAVVANGPLFRRRLVEFGYDPARTFEGASLRYEYLLDAREAPAWEGRPRSVAVAFPIGLEEARELLWQVWEAFSVAGDVEVLLKFHPYAARRQVCRGLSLGAFPAHFRETGEPVSALARKVRALVYTTSTSCLEAVSAGTPALHYAAGSAVDGNPLDFDEAAPFRVECGSAAELRAAAEDFLAGRRSPPDARAAASLMAGLFGRPGREFYKLFLAVEKRRKD